MSNYCIGITGGIGAGKTTIADMFSLLGVPVYSSDDRAKFLMAHDESVIENVIELLGTEAYHADRTLNRQFVASSIFDNLVMLSRINGVVHPAVERDFKSWQEQFDVPFVLKEAALIFESGSFLSMDAVINIHAPIDIRIKRVMIRDQANVESVKKRMEHQWPDDRRQQMADFTILNDGTKSLIRQVIDLNNHLTKICNH